MRVSHAVFSLAIVSFMHICFLPASPAAAEDNPARQALLEKEALARVGDRFLTVDELREELERRREVAPGSVATPEDRRRVLEEMVERHALLAAAEQAGYARHPAVLEVRERMMIETYLRETLDERLAKLTVDDAEVEAHYEAHAERYAIPARSQVAIVFYEASPRATPERRAALREKARATLAEAATLDVSIHHFGELARRDSDHRASRYQGGVAGWITHLPEPSSALPPEVVETVFALDAPGELGPVVETEEGFYLVRLADRREARSQPLEQVASGIRHQLLNEKRGALRAAFKAEIYTELGVEIDFERFESLDLPTDPLVPPALPSRGEAGSDPSGDMR